MDNEIRQRLAVIEAVVTRLDKQLFGNGQPGEIGALKHRVVRLETWLWRATGAVTIVVCILELLTHR